MFDTTSAEFKSAAERFRIVVRKCNLSEQMVTESLFHPLTVGAMDLLDLIAAKQATPELCTSVGVGAEIEDRAGKLAQGFLSLALAMVACGTLDDVRAERHYLCSTYAVLKAQAEADAVANGLINRAH